MKDSNGIRHYMLRSSTEVKMLFMDKKSTMSTDALYDKNGVMSTSHFQNIKEDGKILTKTIWDKGKLLVDKNGELTSLIQSTFLRYCCISMSRVTFSEFSLRDWASFLKSQKRRTVAIPLKPKVVLPFILMSMVN
jgi:hypothetical protein